MKNAFYFLVMALLFSVGSVSATVFRVNNGLTENIPNRLFAQIQTAIKDFTVKDGDTLMVESSGKSYDGFICNKRLVIIGPGYFLGDNNGVNSVATSAVLSENLSGIRFQKGSEGSYLIGVEVSAANFWLETSNIYVIRCKLNYLNLSGSANSKIAMCYIEGPIYDYHNNSNISLTNCVLVKTDNSGLPYSIFENNILASKDYTWTITSGTFRNNILVERDAKVDIKSPTIQNNLAQNNQFGSANGNVPNYAADKLFAGGTSRDGKYQIKTDSPYLTAGYNGTQPGIFGGSEPYVLSGIPPIPIIYELNVPGTGSAASGLNINVKIRGAN